MYWQTFFVQCVGFQNNPYIQTRHKPFVPCLEWKMGCCFLIFAFRLTRTSCFWRAIKASCSSHIFKNFFHFVSTLKLPLFYIFLWPNAQHLSRCVKAASKMQKRATWICRVVNNCVVHKHSKLVPSLKWKIMHFLNSFLISVETEFVGCKLKVKFLRTTVPDELEDLIRKHWVVGEQEAIHYASIAIV